MPLVFSSLAPVLDKGIIKSGMTNDGFYINGNAAALVEQSGDTVVLSFRGTNDYAAKDGSVNPNPYDPNDAVHPDHDQWTNMPIHYSLLAPLINELDSYVAANGINKVYVTGHSMGGAMAIEYMSHHSGDKYQAVTFGASPFGQPYAPWWTFGIPIGTERKDYYSDSRITQIEINKDPVPMAFDIQNLFGETNARPGHVINFLGNQTLDAPDLTQVPIVSDYYARNANHTMDYYRQITDSVDGDSWGKILAEAGTQTILLGGQQVIGTSDFIVDGQLSGMNTDVAAGNDYLVSLDSKVLYGGKGGDTLNGGDNGAMLLGGSGNDFLQGKIGNDRLFGGADNDVLSGAAGNDNLSGGNGNDTLTGDGGNDTLDGGSGVDTACFDSATAGVIVNLDYVWFAQNTINAGLDLLVNIENVVGSNYSDKLTGSYGDNILNGLLGADTLAGGYGNDTYLVDSTSDVVMEGVAAGIDSIRFSVSFTLSDNLEKINLTGSAKIDAIGNALNNVLTGNNVDNAISGGYGNDIISGMKGNDVLTGGAGKDIFRFTTVLNSKTNFDKISDFKPIEDTIQLENAVFKSLVTTGKLAADLFRAGADFTTAIDANDYLIYNKTTGALYYDADANGAGAAVKIALIANHAVLTAADFMVI